MLSDAIRNAILTLLNGEHASGCNPVDLRYQERILRVVAFSILNARVLSPDLRTIRDAINYMIDAGLLEEDIIQSCDDLAESLSCLLQGQLCINDVIDAYVSLLNSEIRVDDGIISYDIEKDTRGLCGAYYTPPDLARKIADYAVCAYFSGQGHVRIPSVFDPACGCGELLVATFEALLRRGLDSDDVLSSMFAADLDPIALQITIVRLFEGTQMPSPDFISEHFMLGNSLICGSGNSRSSRITLFAQERIYSAELGILSQISSRTYDIVIGNPPWRKIRFEDRAFFRQYSSPISDITKKSERQKAIEEIYGTPLYAKYAVLNKDIESFRECFGSNLSFQHSCVGEINTYAAFTELALNILSTSGITALIVKSSMMCSPIYSDMFLWMMSRRFIRHLFFFDNSHRIFDIDSREKFCIAVLGNRTEESFDVSFGLTDPDDMISEDSITIKPSDLEVINPLTHMIPGVSSNRQFYNLMRLHESNDLFTIVFPSCHFGRLVHLTSHSQFISNHSSETNLPILEGKMIGPYTSHFSSFSEISEDLKYTHKAHSGPASSTDTMVEQCRYFIERNAWESITKHYTESYSVFWRSLTSSTNSRTMIATMDRHMPSNQSVQLLQCPDSDDMLLILALFNSSVFDYIIRMKLSGIDLTQKIVKQMPVPPRTKFDELICYHGTLASYREHLISRALFLLGGKGPSSVFDTVRCTGSYEDVCHDVDTLVGLAYGLSEVEISEIHVSLNR